MYTIHTILYLALIVKKSDDFSYKLLLFVLKQLIKNVKSQMMDSESFS